MNTSRAAKTRKRTRIQTEKEAHILEAALEVFSKYGFRGATLDQIANAAGMSKPNLLYYFRTKEAIHQILIDALLDTWLDPLKKMDANGDPITELQSYIRRKLELARDYPRESRLFANEMLQGAPRIQDELKDLKVLVDEKCKIMHKWIRQGKLAKCDPYHLIFSIWATTQHYADFDVQVRTILSDPKVCKKRFEEAQRYLEMLFLKGLTPD